MNVLPVRTWMSTAALSLTLLSSMGCSNQTREVPLRGTFLVTGKIALTDVLAEKLKTSPLTFAWVDKNGIRNPITNVNMDNVTGEFSFDFKREKMIRKMGYSLPEYTALMGWARPLERLSSQGYDLNETGFLRLEAYSEVTNGDSGEIATYVQKIAGLPMSASFSTSRTLVVDAFPIQPLKVGVIKVRVKDANNLPVVGALVSAVPLNVTGGKTYDVKPFDFRTQSPFTPVANLTDSEGTAQVWPVPQGTDKTSKFQISVSRSGYCTQLTSPNFHESTLAPIDVALTPCTDAQTTNPEIDWDVAFPSSLFVLNEARGALPVGTGYTNQEQVELQFTNKSGTIRGFTLQIHEGLTTDDGVIMTQDFPTFANKLLVDLPGTFRNGTTNNGNFLINIIARLSDEDKAAGRKVFTKSLIGNKGVFSLEPVNQEDFIIMGYKNEENLISGQSDSTFTVKYTACRDGYKIGVAISPEGKPNPSVDFVPCSTAGNVFKIKDVFKGFTKQSGNNVAQFFRTDEFSNKSIDDTRVNQVNKVNRRIIELDYGSPDPSQAVFGTDLALVTNSTSLPVYNDLLNNVEITPASIGNYSLVFTMRNSGSSTSSCELINPVPVEDLPTPDSTTGRTVRDFYVGAVKSTAAMQAESLSCTSGKFPLTTSNVSFPATTSGSATLTLTLFDKAGNSATGNVSIPPCPDTSKKVCWRLN